MKITQWVPAAESPRWPCVLSWLNLNKGDHQIQFYKTGPNNPKYSWNKAILDFLATDNEWIWSTHNDVVFDPDTLLRLLSWDQPLISALVFMRTSPVVPHIWKTYPDTDFKYALRVEDTRKWFMEHKDYIKFGAFVMDPRPDDALVDIGFTSTSCTLIHRSVLEAMRENVKDQWFLMDDDYVGGGEDRRFFEEAKKVGFTGYVDRSCIVGHLVGDVPTSAADFMAWDAVSTFRGIGEPERKQDVNS